MAIFQPLNTYKPTTQGLPEIQPSSTNYSLLPFEALVSKIDENSGEIYIKISPYSNIYAGFDSTDSIPISGLDFSFPIRYKSKVYLETFFDKNGTPVYSKIKSNPKWSSTVINPATRKAEATYPNTIELITSLDIESKINELKQDNTNNDAVRDAHIQQIEDLRSSGYYSSAEAQAFRTLIQQRYADIKTTLDTYIAEMPQFFSGFSSLTRKMYKTITLIAYTTKDLNPNLKGKLIVPTTPLRQGSPPAINTAEESKKFKLVQCASSDFMIVDCYFGNNAAKTLIPWNRGINDYLIGETLEEEINTK